MLITVVLLNIYVETIIFWELFDDYKVQKNGICLKFIFFLCFNAFTITFDKFNGSLLHKSIFFLYIYFKW